MPATPKIPNPIIRTVPMVERPGWYMREYLDGTFDADKRTGVALTPVVDSPLELLEWIDRAEGAAR